MSELDIKVQITSPPKKPIEIRLENAKNYSHQDRIVHIADKQQHLKLRLYKKPSTEKVWVYDYKWKGKRYMPVLGSLKYLTPTQARKKVMEYEIIRTVHKRDPFSMNVKEITLSNYFETYLEHKDIKPSKARDGSRLGVSETELRERKYKFEKYIRNSDVGQVPLVSLKKSKVQEWYDNIKHIAPTQALRTLWLASHITEYACKSNDELDNVSGNIFKRIDTKADRKKINKKRQHRPIQPNEIKAIFKACEEWDKPLDALYVQFIMHTGSRGKPVRELLKEDIVWNKQYKCHYFTAFMKHEDKTIAFTPELENIYQQILKAHKDMRIISKYLFPSIDYRGRNIAVRNQHMNKQDLRRLWTGTKGNGGIRKLASQYAPSVMGVKENNTRLIEEFGEWKRDYKPIGLHDIRDTFATATDVALGTKLIQNNQESTTIKHYTGFEPFEKTKEYAEKRTSLIKNWIKE